MLFRSKVYSPMPRKEQHHPPALSPVISIQFPHGSGNKDHRSDAPLLHYGFCNKKRTRPFGTGSIHRLETHGPRPKTVCRLAAHKTYSTPAGRAMPTPGPKGRPSIIQITRKMIQAICRTTAMGIMLEIRVPMAQSGMYFS